MAALLVVDSNIMLARLLPVPYTDKAKNLAERWEKQNTLFQYEVVAVVRRYLHHKIIGSDEAALTLNTLLTAKIDYHVG